MLALPVIGGWLWIQREIRFGSDAIRVRRWLEVLLGRPGRIVLLDAGTRTAIVLENVRSFRLEHDGFARIQLTRGYWDLREIRRLVEVIRTRNIPLDQYWVGDLPPGTGWPMRDPGRTSAWAARPCAARGACQLGPSA